MLHNSENCIVPIILCGGHGSRLEPLSTPELSKPFLKLFDGLSTFQQTILRVTSSDLFMAPLICCKINDRIIVENQLEEIHMKDYQLILEPYVKNTAPAITAAALWLVTHDINNPALILPSDHISSLSDNTIYTTFFDNIMLETEDEHTILFGSKWNEWDPGFGYIKPAKKTEPSQLYRLEKFIEKPEAQLEDIMRQEGWLRHSGIVLSSPSNLLHVIASTQPALIELCRQALAHSKQSGNKESLYSLPYKRCPSISIDEAIHSLPENLVSYRTAELPFLWEDFGTWDRLWKILPKNDHSNASIGDVTWNNCTHCLGIADSPIHIENLDHHIVIQQGEKQCQIPWKKTG